MSMTTNAVKMTLAFHFLHITAMTVTVVNVQLSSSHCHNNMDRLEMRFGR